MDQTSQGLLTNKKEQGPYSAIFTEHVKSVYELLYVIRNNFILWDTAHNPHWQDSAILPNGVANHNAGLSDSENCNNLIRRITSTIYREFY